MFSFKEFYKNVVEITTTKLTLLEMINKSYLWTKVALDSVSKLSRSELVWGRGACTWADSTPPGPQPPVSSIQAYRTQYGEFRPNGMARRWKHPD